MVPPLKLDEHGEKEVVEVEILPNECSKVNLKHLLIDDGVLVLTQLEPSSLWLDGFCIRNNVAFSTFLHFDYFV